jgi:small subunit ribosomal protein S21
MFLPTVYNSRNDIEDLIKRFRKKVTKENILVETKKRKYYSKPSQKKHEKDKKLKRKKLKKMRRNKKYY